MSDDQDDEPTTAAEMLHEQLERLRQRQPRRQAPIDYEDPEMEEFRRQGIDAMRVAQWTTMCPSRFLGAALDDVDEPHRSRCAAWAKHIASRNLVILGPVGTGKTHAALATSRVCHDRGLDVLFWPVISFMDRLKAEFGGQTRDTLDGAMESDLLVLDDLGVELQTTWSRERLYTVLNRRWLDELPTIATTNVPLSRKMAPTGDVQTLEDALGERAYSRLLTGALVIRLSGDDRRFAPGTQWG